MIRVLIVDDHQVVREGLRFVLEQEPDIEVVGEAGDGRAALAAIRALSPDVVLLDMMMPVLDGKRVLDALRAGEPGPAVVVLTSYTGDDEAIDAVRAGALSYLQKSAAIDRVTDAVRAAATGGSILDPGVTALLVNRLRELDDGPLKRLSARERDVLATLARGRSNREIARALSISEQTVKSYVSSILTKLDLQDRTQAAIFGLQQGLVPLDEALRPRDLGRQRPALLRARADDGRAVTRHRIPGGHPSHIYLRTDPAQVTSVASVLAATTDPENPEQVQASRPSEALTARLLVAKSSTTLYVGLGAVALLVAAVGVANVMIISVLERRTEIGLRRALGAARHHVAAQFLAESVLLAVGGGLSGVAIGAGITAAVAHANHWAVLIPATTVGGGVAIGLGIGIAAGLYPAVKAAMLAPTEALRAV